MKPSISRIFDTLCQLKVFVDAYNSEDARHATRTKFLKDIRKEKDVREAFDTLCALSGDIDSAITELRTSFSDLPRGDKAARQAWAENAAQRMIPILQNAEYPLWQLQREDGAKGGYEATRFMIDGIDSWERRTPTQLYMKVIKVLTEELKGEQRPDVGTDPLRMRGSCISR